MAAVFVIASCFQPQQDTAGADSDDDWSMGSKKGKKGKAAPSKGKGSKAAGGGSSGSGSAAGSKQQKGAADVNSILGVNILAQQVLKLYPDMEDAGEQLLKVGKWQQVLDPSMHLDKHAFSNASDSSVRWHMKTSVPA